MNEDESRQVLDDQDHNLGVVMAYFSHLASTPEATRTNPGSELDKHSRKYTDSQQHQNPAYLVWRAIASASEHAGFAEHMRFITTGGVVARPQASLARVTFLGAARALYILMPDNPRERIIRAAKLANQEANDAQRMLDAWRSQANSQDDFLDDLDNQTQELANSAAKILAEAGRKERSTIDETSMLKEVISQLSDAPHDAEEQVLALWNRLSGVSHARSWTWSIQTGVDPRSDFVHTWSIPILLLTKAWELWNLRRDGGTNPNLPPDYWEPDRSRWGKVPAVKRASTRDRIGLEPVQPNSSTRAKCLEASKRFTSRQLASLIQTVSERARRRG